MKCFYHHDTDAVAICKSCQRALCVTCAMDVPPGTACINRCEKDVAALNLVIERSKSAYQKTGLAYKRNAVVMSVIGIVFFVTGVWPIVAKGKYGMAFIAVMGVLFVVWAYFNYRSGKQIESAEKNA